MTVREKVDIIREFYGDSTDAKPINLIGAGHRFIETNTGAVFIWDGYAWTDDLEIIAAIQEGNPNHTVEQDIDDPDIDGGTIDGATITGCAIVGGTMSGVNVVNLFTSATDPAASAATAVAIVDAYNGVLITLTGAGNDQTLASPTTVASIKTFTVINNDTSTNNIAVIANTVSFTITPGEAQSFVWDSTAWGPTDLGITSLPVPVTQGGTQAVTLTDHGVLVGSGTDPVTPLAALAAGELLVGVGSADPHALAAGATTKILVGGGAADPVWTEATGTGSPVRATSPVLTTPTRAAAIADNDSSRALADTAFAKSQDAVLAREPDQGVAMTYAASGSSGITVADNDNIDFGTGNFTLVWKGSLPDWTPSVIGYLITKTDAAVTSGFVFSCQNDGTFRVRLNATNYVSTVANSFTDNSAHEIKAVITRESASVAGSVVFYVDGYLLGAAVAITAGVPASINTTTALEVLGLGVSGGVRVAGTTHHAYTFNRALTAAEVLDLYRNGIAEADKWGSQTSLVTGTDSDFSGAGNWVGTSFGTFDVNSTVAGKAYMLGNGGADYMVLNVPVGWMKQGKRYRISLKARLNAGASTTIYVGRNAMAASAAGGGAFAITPTGTETTFSGEIVNISDNGPMYIGNEAGFNGIAFEIDDVTCIEIGATLALEPSGIKTPKWFDSSTNALDASYPATGSSLTLSYQPGTESLLSITTVSLAADADTTIFTVPTGRRCVLTKAILVVGADAASTDFSIGADGAETDWLPTNQLDNLDAANDAAILMPVPSTTPSKIESYAAGTVIQAKVSNQAGGATNTLYLFGFLY